MWEEEVLPTRLEELEKRIDAAIAENPGAWRREIARQLEVMDDWKRDNEGRRTHLGASVIGRPCARSIALSYRHASPDASAGNGRMVRLFNRGHMEEARLVAALVIAGLKVKTISKTGGQISYQMTALKGSVDGVCLLDGTLTVLEFKTMNKRSFETLERSECIKVEHLTQMQCGMQGLGLTQALYVASCKDDDRIMCFLVPAQPGTADDADNLAHDIVFGDIPGVGSRTQASADCRFCDHKAICWEGKEMDRSCRTCVHAKLEGNGKVTCGLGTGTELCEHYEQVNLK